MDLGRYPWIWEATVAAGSSGLWKALEQFLTSEKVRTPAQALCSGGTTIFPALADRGVRAIIYIYKNTVKYGILIKLGPNI